jgi:hypothetical protein
MLRRLNELAVFENGWGPALVRRSGERLLIEYAVYPPWLMTHTPAAPKRGTEFAAWFGATVHSNGTLAKDAGDERLEAVPTDVTSSLIIFELRLQSH